MLDTARIERAALASWSDPKQAWDATPERAKCKKVQKIGSARIERASLKDKAGLSSRWRMGKGERAMYGLF